MAMVPGKAPTPPTVTIKHLAAALAETHEMSKKQAETVLGDLVGNIVKHLKKGERIRIGGLGNFRFVSALPALAATLRPASKFRSRRAKRSPSALQKS